MRPLFISIVTLVLLITESTVKIQARRPVSNQKEIPKFQQRNPGLKTVKNKGIQDLAYPSGYSQYPPRPHYPPSRPRPNNNYFGPQSDLIQFPPRPRPQQYQYSSGSSYNQPPIAYPAKIRPNHYQYGGNRPQGNGDRCSEQCSKSNGNQACASCCRYYEYQNGGSCYRSYCTCRN